MNAEALPAVVSMIVCNDRGVLRDATCLALLAPKNEWARISQAADTIHRIWTEFDYLLSPEFEEATSGRSAAALVILKRMAP
jgi:hypothetical protein